MENIASLYALFDIELTCSDGQLRAAYRQQLLRHHPDLHPEDVAAATTHTQRLNAAYEALKEHREHRTSSADATMSRNRNAWQDLDKFGSSPTLKAIVGRKSRFRDTWNAFSASPRDVMRALAFIHAAIEMERTDAVAELLGNPILIDAAALLLEIAEPSPALDILLKWSDQLIGIGRYLDAVEILEDCLTVPMPSYALYQLKDNLRMRHYRVAQGNYTPDKQKPAPDIRISHLTRILDLGFELSYIYKFLAEAYLDKGDQDTARQHLERGFSLDPQLSAVRLAKALGVTPPQRSQKSERADPRLSRGVDLIGGVSRKTALATVSQVRNWIASGSWEQLLALANRPDYGSRDRETMRLLATGLRACPDTQAAQQPLLALSRSVYWDVRRAAYASLCRVGDASALDALRHAQTIDPNYSGLNACIDYLECRNDPKRVGADHVRESEALAQGRRALNGRRFGLARFWFERALHIAPAQENNSLAVIPVSDDVGTVFMLAQACFEMGDIDQALQLMAPLLERNPTRAGSRVQRAVADWLWSQLVFSRYDPANDDLYILAIKIHSNMALQTEDPRDLLHWLRYLTRWLEHLGAEELILWIRHLVRDAAPGYGELERGMGYGHNISGLQPSEKIVSALGALESQIRAGLPHHLREVFGTTLTIKGKTGLLED